MLFNFNFNKECHYYTEYCNVKIYFKDNFGVFFML